MNNKSKFKTSLFVESFKKIGVLVDVDSNPNEDTINNINKSIKNKELHFTFFQSLVN